MAKTRKRKISWHDKVDKMGNLTLFDEWRRESLLRERALNKLNRLRTQEGPYSRAYNLAAKNYLNHHDRVTYIGLLRERRGL